MTAAKSGSATPAALTDAAGIAAAERLGVALTHPEREEYPGISKAHLIAYYEAVAERMLPHIVKRPLSLVRSPRGGFEHTFFQKHDSGGFPAQFKRIPIVEPNGTGEDSLYVDGFGGVVAGVQMNTLEFHIWGSHIADIEKPDRIIFDIDPDEGLDFEAVRDAALHIRETLGKWALDSFAMVTGGKGIHVIAPLQPLLEWPEVKLFCKTFADKLATNEPERFTSNIRKAARKGRMFVDYLRNERGSTAVAPFSTRARAGAPCAVPVGWEELKTLKSANAFSLAEAAARANAADPWKDYFALTQTITKAMLSAVAGDKMEK